MRGTLTRVWLERAGALLTMAVVLEVVGQSMARYPSPGNRGAALWLCVDLLLLAAVARGRRRAWRVLVILAAFGAALFLIVGMSDLSGFQLQRGVLYAAQVVVLLSPAVRTRVGWAPRGRRIDTAPKTSA